MNAGLKTWMFVVMLVVVVALPVVPALPEQAREDYSVHHVSAFSDGKAEKMINFNAPGTDKSASIALPNGARVISASMNITGLPTTDGGTDYPENITVDAGNDGSLEYAFQGKGYGRMGYQTLFANGATYLNVSLPQNGGTNATPSVRLPKNATVTSIKMDLANLRGGGGGGLRVAIECAAASTSRDDPNNDPPYTLKTLLQTQGWAADIVVGTDIDTQQELNQYSVVLTGDSGNNDDDHASYESALEQWVRSGGGFVGLGWIIYSTLQNTAMDRILPIMCNGYVFDTSGTITITNNNHDITTGVNNFPVQSYVESSSGGADNGATVLATNPSSKPCVTCWNLDLGRAVCLGPVSFGNFAGYSGTKAYYSDNNFKTLLLNSISWCAGKRTLNCSLDIANDGNIEW